MKKIVVTGGLGFIGSHTSVEVMAMGHEVIIIDNLSNSRIEVLDGIEKISGKRPAFHQFDLRDKDKVADFFENQKDIDGVIHFAACKAVGESVENPLKYFENNINALTYVLQQTAARKIPLIFSSSCTVYGEPDQLPITEDAPVKPAESPYGYTKQVGEYMVQQASRAADGFNAISLRYFNPIGAHPSAEIGELPIGTPANLIPFLTQSAAGIRGPLQVFGDDYPTEDGTAIRDYIHVVDLANAHVVALERLMEEKQDEPYEIFNVGTGKGNSVMEVINAFANLPAGRQERQPKLNYEIAPRRDGDVVQIYADTTKASDVLGWKAKYSLEDSLSSAWKWQQKLVQESATA